MVAGLATTAIALPAAGCNDQASTLQLATGPVQPLVVDTDLASDDLVALAFLLSSPQADVRAITVSGTGEVRCPAGLGVVRGLLGSPGTTTYRSPAGGRPRWQGSWQPSC